ncbi:MAG: transglycosylase SLT domain-containing protein, partial [Candidatus Cloacimonetes bacterium]|nr:transglycosylase SLT domain-containing protein [Candidatus Cloacimonadota bacterium]
SFLGDKPQYDYYHDIFIDEVAKKISDTSNLGIADTISRQVKNMNNPPDQIQNQFFELNKLNNQAFAWRERIMELNDTIQGRLDEIKDTVEKAADKYGLDKNLIMAVIIQESYADPTAVSPVGAKGLMQLMDETAKYLGVRDSFNVEENINGGARYLKEQIDNFDDVKLALAAYNAGPNAVKKHGGIPPFAETQKYVTRVLNYFEALSNEDNSKNNNISGNVSKH